MIEPDFYTNLHLNTGKSQCLNEDCIRRTVQQPLVLEKHWACIYTFYIGDVIVENVKISFENMKQKLEEARNSSKGAKI